MRTQIVVVCVLLLAMADSFGQNGFNRLYRYEGDTILRGEMIASLAFDSVGNNLFFTCDGIYQTEFKFTSSLFKTDLNGNVTKVVWDSFYGGLLAYGDVALSKDHKYIYWGGWVTDITDVPNFKSWWKVRKTDTNLNIIWDKYYEAEEVNLYLSSIKMLPEDESFLVSMYAWTPETEWGLPVVYPKTYVKHIDSSGQVINEFSIGQGFYDDCSRMELTDDGNYLLTGDTNSWNAFNFRAFDLKGDLAGNELWHQLYAEDVYKSSFLDVKRTKDLSESYWHGGYVRMSPDKKTMGYINKVSGNGEELWRKYAAMDSSIHEYVSVVNAANNSDLFAVGSSRYYPYFNYDPVPRGWITRFDEDGNIKWNKLFQYQTPPDIPDMDHYLYRVVALPDGGIVAAGSSFGLDQYGRASADGWLIRVDSNGCVRPGGCGLEVGIEEPVAELRQVKAYPNPATDKFTIELFITAKEANKKASLELRDSKGRLMEEHKLVNGNNQIDINLENFAAGTYFYSIIVGGKVAKTDKLNIIH